MNVLDNSTTRQPRTQHLIDMHGTHSTRQDPSNRTLERVIFVGRMREESQFTMDGPQKRVKWLEEEATSVLTGDGFRQPGCTTAAASQY